MRSDERDGQGVATREDWKPQIPPLRWAPVGMTILLRNGRDVPQG
jgi:hypothetical protein